MRYLALEKESRSFNDLQVAIVGWVNALRALESYLYEAVFPSTLNQVLN
jgi:hypothetical protein